jgi:hypothetical protein
VLPANAQLYTGAGSEGVLLSMGSSSHLPLLKSFFFDWIICRVPKPRSFE